MPHMRATPRTAYYALTAVITIIDNEKVTALLVHVHVFFALHEKMVNEIENESCHKCLQEEG